VTARDGSSSGERHDEGSRTLAPFRYPAFRAIWIANLASNLGTAIQSVAAAWLMTELTASHLLIALVQSSATLPILMLGMFAGAIADNYDRRRVMLAAQTGMLAVSAGLAVTTALGLITPVMLLMFTLALGTGTALNAPAWQASVRLQVGLRDVPQAIALNSIAFNLARSVGPAIGGLLISLTSPALAFAINSASFVAMIVVLARWRPEMPRREKRRMLPAIAIGIRYCMQSSPIRRVLLRGLALGFGMAAYQALIPSIVHDGLGGDELDYGLILGLFGAGSICAALALGAVRRRFGVENVLAGGTATFVMALWVLGATRALAWALPVSFIAGLGWVSILTSLNVAMQIRSPEEILGRCLSLYQAVTFGAMALGAWIWGSMADWRGLPFALHAASAFLALSLGLRFVAPMPLPGEGRPASDARETGTDDANTPPP